MAKNKILQGLDTTSLFKYVESTAGSSSTTSSTQGDITSATISVTIDVQSDIYVEGVIQAYSNPGAVVEYLGQLTDNSNAGIGREQQFSLQPGNKRVQVPLRGVYLNKAAGTYTFKLRHRNGDNATSVTAEAVQMNVRTTPHN